MKSVGTTFMPVTFTDTTTKQKFRIVLYALVVPNMSIGMFIGQGADFISKFQSGPGLGKSIYTFDFGEGGVYKVKGLL
jgi:hypothetical protein